MKCILPLVVMTFTALLLTGCESSGTTARIQEKSATYAALAPEQQEAIQAGTVDLGYTSDMVYLSLGQPSKIETKETADGTVTVWTYTRFYPTKAVAETWSVSRYEPAKLQVLFYEDKVFDAALEQGRSMVAVDLVSNRGFPEPQRQTPGMIAAGLTPNANPPMSYPPFVKP